MKIAGVWSGHDASFCIIENPEDAIKYFYQQLLIICIL